VISCSSTIFYFAALKLENTKIAPGSLAPVDLDGGEPDVAVMS